MSIYVKMPICGISSLSSSYVFVDLDQTILTI